MNYQKEWKGKMMLVFRYRIRKFLEKKLYCENASSKNCSVVSLNATGLCNGFLKLGEGRSFKTLIELSDCRV